MSDTNKPNTADAAKTVSTSSASKAAGAAPATPKAAKKEKKFEAVVRVNLGKAGVREPGDTILESEMSAEDRKQFLALNIIRDGDAPIPPSQAEGHVAFDRLSSVAQRVGALTRDGGAYTLAGQSYQGVEAFRKAASLQDLENAIVAAFEERE